jgi:hypothetical protein
MCGKKGLVWERRLFKVKYNELSERIQYKAKDTEQQTATKA